MKKIIILFSIIATSTCVNAFLCNVSNQQIDIFPKANAETTTQNEIKQIENYIKEFHKAGIFVKVINKGSDSTGSMLEIQVDEYAWNNLPYDAKKATENMFLRYWQIGHVTVIFKGYRTGQVLSSVDRNFKI